MMWRLNDIPAYSSYPTVVDAKTFNTIRRAIIKHPAPLRITLSSLSHVDILIDEDSWVCVDNTNNDMPIVAWINFHTANRSDLTTPIKCTKNYYHFGAAKIATIALKEAITYLKEHFAPAPVCSLPPPNKVKKVWKTSTKAVLSCV